MLVMTRMKKGEPEYNVPSWSEGTDAEIVNALKLHYQGKINLHDYWSAGLDERVVHLSAMDAQYVGESHVEQDVTLVLMNEGGKMLADGITECAFVVGQKEMLMNGNTIETGYIHSTNTNTDWDTCERREWCNEVYRNAIPKTLRPAFKKFINKTITDISNGNLICTESEDYFGLSAVFEVYGDSIDYPLADENSVQLKYYKTTSNRIKTPEGQTTQWWLRTHGIAIDSITRQIEEIMKSSAYMVNRLGYNGASNVNSNLGIAPFGVI